MKIVALEACDAGSSNSSDKEEGCSLLVFYKALWKIMSSSTKSKAKNLSAEDLQQN